MPEKSEKPVFLRQAVGIETAEPARALHEDMKLETRRRKEKKAARQARSEKSGWRKLFSPGSWFRFLLTFGLFGLVLHGLFVFFGIYQRNQRLPAGDHMVLVIKLVVFMALMYLFYAMLMHYGPIRHRVRSIFFMALAPVAAVCIFMIYGGGDLFGSFLPVLQFLTLTVGVAGFLLYVMGYTWLAGRSVRRENRRMRQYGGLPTLHDDPYGLPALGAAGTAGRGTGMADRRRIDQPGNLRLRQGDGGDGANGSPGTIPPTNAGGRSGKLRLPEI